MDQSSPDISIDVDAEVRRALAGIPRGHLVIHLSVRDHPSAARSDATVDPVTAFLRSRAPVHAHLSWDVAGLLLQVELLNHYRVPLGVKAIAVYMHRTWTDQLVAEFGPAANANTLRRWAARMRRGADPMPPIAARPDGEA